VEGTGNAAFRIEDAATSLDVLSILQLCLPSQPSTRGHPIEADVRVSIMASASTPMRLVQRRCVRARSTVSGRQPKTLPAPFTTEVMVRIKREFGGRLKVRALSECIKSGDNDKIPAGLFSYEKQKWHFK
jgi:hypothetical protein